MSNFNFVGKVISFNDPEYGLTKDKDISSSFLTDADKNLKDGDKLVEDLEVGTVYPGGLLVNKVGKYRNLGKEKPNYKGLQPKLSDIRESKQML